MYGDSLSYGHARDPVRAGRFAVGSHQRIAVNPCPQHLQVAQQGLQPLLSRTAGQQYLVKDEECSMTGHDCKTLVPDLFDGPELWLHCHGAVWLQYKPGPRMVSPAGESLGQDVRTEREP
jgi:hypothetical protein